MNDIFLNTIGVPISITLEIDLTGISVLRFDVTKPDSTVVVWTPSVVGTRELSYTTVAGDLDQIGTWKIDPYVEVPSWKGYSDPIIFSVIRTTDAVVISDEDLNEIKTVIGYPKIDNLILEDNDIRKFCVKPALDKYFVKFPISTVYQCGINGELVIPFPDEYVFGVMGAGITDRGTMIGTGTSFWDLIAYNNMMGSVSGSGAYGIRGYNPSGLYQQRSLQRFAMQSVQNQNSTFKYRIDKVAKTLTAYSSISATLYVIWASRSYLFDNVTFQRKEQVKKLAKANLLNYVADTSSIVTDSSLDVTINIDALKARAEKLEDEVMTLWNETPVVVYLHGV